MAYQGRRAPNVSEYVANLNMNPTAQDLERSQASYNIQAELDMFTNTEFVDFDNYNLESADANVQFDGTDGLGGQSVASDMDFLNGDLSFSDFNNFNQPTFSENGPPEPTNTSRPAYAASSGAGSPVSSTPNTAAGSKRKADSITQSPENIEDASRLAAEEDKRRRNTAASARFRVKKKQREQALERSAKDMSDKVAALEGRISQLETENKWLKNLITEKNESPDDVQALWKKYSEDNKISSKTSGRKDGVGTCKSS